MVMRGGRNDRLAEATNGKHFWNDPGMDDLEAGWEEFPLGTRVEVRTDGNIWRKGTVVETHNENDRAICVECDERWHDNLEFYGGRGVTVMVYMNTRRGILSLLRLIDEPRRAVVISVRAEGQRAAPGKPKASAEVCVCDVVGDALRPNGFRPEITINGVRFLPHSCMSKRLANRIARDVAVALGVRPKLA